VKADIDSGSGDDQFNQRSEARLIVCFVLLTMKGVREMSCFPLEDDSLPAAIRYPTVRPGAGVFRRKPRRTRVLLFVVLGIAGFSLRGAQDKRVLVDRGVEGLEQDPIASRGTEWGPGGPS
jgi:hypothetical protein